MDTITTLLRVTGLMFAAAGLVAAVLVLPRAGADRGRLEKATDSSVLRKSGNFPNAAVLVVNDSILANGLGLTADMGPRAKPGALAASAAALALDGLVVPLRTSIVGHRLVLGSARAGRALRKTAPRRRIQHTRALVRRH